jgi:hypothetical protein|tara:strand:+ start:569 stop:1141 length:573 start_codon:yes stop_codon:yes gene_type:complete
MYGQDGESAMSKDFVQHLQAEISALEAELAEHPAFKKLEALKHSLALYHGEQAPSRVVMPGMPGSQPATQPPVRQRSRSSRSAIKERILKHVDGFFGDHDGPYTTGQIFDSVERAGLEVPGTNPRNNLSAMLSNSDDFVSTPDGWVRALSFSDSNNEDDAVGQVAEAPDVAPSGASNCEENSSRLQSLLG